MKEYTENYDLAIAYRVYPKVSKICGLYSVDDKYALFKLCLKSLQISLDGIQAKLIVILDSCPVEYEELFIEYFRKEDLEFHYVNPGGNDVTFGMQMELLSKQNYSEVVYFAEDDYFYFEDSFREMIQFIKDDDVDFVTSYDLLDYHHSYLHEHKKELKKRSDVQWRKVASTTLTFMSTKSALMEPGAYNNLIQFVNGHKDTIIWLRMTKFRVLNPLYLIVFVILALRSRISNFIGLTKNSQLSRPGIKHMFETYIDGGSRLLWKTRKYTLWAPEKSMSTHMVEKFLPQGIDWQSEFSSFTQKHGLKEITIKEGYHGFLKN